MIRLNEQCSIKLAPKINEKTENTEKVAIEFSVLSRSCHE